MRVCITRQKSLLTLRPVIAARLRICWLPDEDGTLLPRYVFVHGDARVCLLRRRGPIKLFTTTSICTTDNPSLDVQMVPVSVMFWSSSSVKDKLPAAAYVTVYKILRGVITVAIASSDSLRLFLCAVWLMSTEPARLSRKSRPASRAYTSLASAWQPWDTPSCSSGSIQQTAGISDCRAVEDEARENLSREGTTKRYRTDGRDCSELLLQG